MIYGNLSTLKELFLTMSYWVFVTNMFGFIRYSHHEIIPDTSAAGHVFHLIQIASLIGMAIGFVLYLVRVAISDKNFGYIPYGRLIVYQTSIYVVIIGTLMALVQLIVQFNVYGVVNRQQFNLNFFTLDTLVAILTFLFFAALYNFLYQIAQKFGPRNFWRMITGKYFNPVEEEKIFMFLDLKSSTTIAEKIGHKQYSKLIQECFKDISVIGDYGGEVYQYVGDEAVFTWDANSPKAHKKCIRAFYAFQKRIIERSDFYKEKFGVVPQFKAGVHGGTVMVAEVGIMKKEIAFHGDTINTAARIQAMCNEKERIFLTSDYFEQMVTESADVDWEDMGDIVLKGRKSMTRLYHPVIS